MGHLDPNWLSIEFASVEAEIESWAVGLKTSFASLAMEPEMEASGPSEESKDSRACVTAQLAEARV